MCVCGEGGDPSCVVHKNKSSGRKAGGEKKGTYYSLDYVRLRDYETTRLRDYEYCRL